jgi:DNA-binding SARP family transcriptional activator/class 3 adenylate cyclase/pimeloyl-ACP methyl ester carboxylesterase
MAGVRIGVLGPIELVNGGGTAVPLPRAKVRALLAALAINLNRHVGRHALIEALWGEAPPDGAEATLVSYVSQLRRALASAAAPGAPAFRLTSQGGGYQLEGDPDALDSGRFERLAAEGAAALRGDEAPRADRLLAEALALWRGHPYAEFADQTFTRLVSDRLAEARLAALENHIEAALILGRHAATIGQLEELVANYPLRERLCAQLMRALYRSGRQADALAAYGRLRLRLAEELGIEPSGELRALERAVLQQQPELDQPRPDVLSPLPTSVPPISFARSGDVHIAYQVVGDGPVDLVFVPGIMNHLELLWEKGTEAERFFRRLASFSRLILFDKRGTGLSDRDIGHPSLDQRMDDLRAVMDAAGSERAAVMGYSEGGPLSILFATTHPERVSALVLACTVARTLPAPDYPCGHRMQAFIKSFRRLIDDGWGRGDSIEWLATNLAQNSSARANVARWERLAASPGSVATFLDLLAQIDVREMLPAIQVPTLVIHRSEDAAVEPCHARYLADHIPGARLIEQPGGNHILWSDVGTLADEIESFVKGAPVETDTHSDRVLTTVVFTDIVGSTEKAGVLGDHRWRELLDRHDELSRIVVGRFRGEMIKTTGDGLLATFDGPARAVRCALALGQTLRSLDLEIRVGVHTGEVERRGHDIGGIAVHLSQRVNALAAPGQVLVSGTVHDLVIGSGLEFEAKGSRTLRGVPGKWRLFAAVRG